MRGMTAAATVPRRLFYCFRFPAAAVAACISSTEMQAATAAACLSFDGISRPSTTATVFPLTAVCVRLARDQNLGLVGQGGRGAFQFMRQMTQSWNFRNIVRLFTNIKYVRTLGGEGVKYPENSAVSVGFDVMVKYGVFLYSPLSPSCDQMRSGKGTERLFPYFAHLLSHWPVADRCHTNDLELFEALITIRSLT